MRPRRLSLHPLRRFGTALGYERRVLGDSPLVSGSSGSRGERRESDDFAQEAERGSSGLLRDFVDFLRHYKKWWLLPILIVLLLAGVIAVLGGTAVAPFIYTLF